MLSVTKEDYTNCNTENPIQKFTDGHTLFTFEHSGPYYFISGVKDNCLKNEKLIVVVMADRSKHAPPPNETVAAPPPSNETVAAPPPSNGTVEAPPPSPSAEVPPSPAPATGESPPPPGSGHTNPTPAPSQQSSPPKKNGATSILFSFFGSLGALAGSSLLLFF